MGELQYHNSTRAIYFCQIKFSPPTHWVGGRCLAQGELDSDSHDDRYGAAVEQSGSEFPLPNRVERGLVEQGDRT